MANPLYSLLDCASHEAVDRSNWVNLIRDRALHQPNRLAFGFLPDGEIEPDLSHTLSYHELDRQSRAIAAQLQALGLSGERALLLHPPGLEYIAAFFGCLYAGVGAVPAYPPRNARGTPRIQAVVRDAQAAIALTTKDWLPKVQALMAEKTHLESLQWLATDDITPEIEADWQAPFIHPDTLAFLQYTSGSTGTPKGVMLSHANLLHNAAVTYRCMEHSPASTFISWLPMYHDMGLIGGILQPLYGGFPCILMPPAAFLQRPYRWLQAISHYQGTTSGGPNFAYDFCVRKATPEQRATLNLSTWSVAFNGAEPVRQDTLERFAATFAECGFRQSAFYPCYGMAEASLIVSGGLKAAPPQFKTIQAEALEQGQVKDANSEPDAQTIVGCGQTMPDQQIVIAHPETRVRCQPHEVGEIWVAGSSVGQGYWNRPPETEETFQAYLADSGAGPFLRTGDLGFLAQGELFVTGRLKDLIIIRGRNLYPQDLEMTAERSHPALRAGSGAAFTVTVGSEEQLVIVQELEFRQKPDGAEVTGEIRRAIADHHEVQAHSVVLIKPGTIPKTSSGKIQRRACRSAFLAGTLDVIARSDLNDTQATASSEAAEAFPRRDDLLQLGSTTERAIAYLHTQVAQILGVAPSQIEAQQPLTQFGLDSLKAFELKHQIETDLSVEIPVASFFEGLAIAQLAAQIVGLSQVNLAHKADSPLKLQQMARSGAIPLSFTQESLWLLCQREPESPFYTNAAAIQLTGALNETALRESWNEILNRHESLRTTIITREGQPLQKIFPNLTLDLPLIDWQTLPAAEQEAALQNLTQAWVQAPFDLAGSPLIRAQLVRLAPQHHVLLLAIHHLIFDGGSVGVLWDELTTLYQAFSHQIAAPKLKPLLIQYADFALWQRQWLQGEEFNQQLAYWKQQLGGELPVLALPTDRPRSAPLSFQGKRQAITFSKDLTQALKDLGQQEVATLFMTLLAAFQTLLYRYTGQTDILVGTPIAGRSQVATESLIGCFVNTLVLRAHPQAELSFRQFLQQVRQVALESYAHAEVPFSKLVEALQPSRNLSHTPLFQVMLILQAGPLPALELPDLQWQVSELDPGAAKFDLTLNVWETTAGMEGWLEYSTDLFDAATIARLTGHLYILLASIAANPDQSLAYLPLLTPAEQQQFTRWNQTQAAYPQVSLTQLFEQQAAKTPEAVAVIEGDRSLTYQNLNQQANQLAYYLRSLGVGLETLVGICCDRSLEAIVGILAILKAGGAYVPLDPGYPVARRKFMLQDSQIRILLTTQPHRVEEMLSDGADSPVPVVINLNDVATWAHHPVTNLVSLVTPDHLAYVLYTSGSTGTPKGVQGLHRGVINRCQWMWQTYPFQPGEVCCQKTSLSFVDSVWEVVGPLLQGVPLVVISDPVLKDLPQFVDTLSTQAVTRLVLVPSLLRALLVSFPDLAQRLPQLSLWISSGEALDLALVQQFQRQLPGRSLLNLYGSSEVAADVTAYLIDSSVETTTVPIGRAIANTKLYVLDAAGQQVPIGAIGELHVGGDGLARGYWNRPDLTAERFVRHTFSNVPEVRLYKTGDLVRYRTDGLLEFCGRIDQQVKLRGHRIELGDIEAGLRQHPAVQMAIALLRQDDPDFPQLVAYVVLQSGQASTSSELRQFLLTTLPDYMQPSAIVVLEQVPLTPNGKVNRRALPIPDPSENAATFVAAQTAAEVQMADLWASVLGREQVGIHDNFFDLGGHSLLATQLISQVRDAFQVEVPLRQLFAAPTVAGLTDYVERSRTQTQSPSLPPIQPLAQQEYPLSFAQQRLWFLSQLEPDNPAYNIPGAVKIQGALNRAALEWSLNQVIRRHEVLQTTIVTRQGQPVQVIAPNLSLSLPEVDLRSLSAPEQNSQIQQYAQAIAQHRLDLTQGPLLCGRLLQLTDADFILLLTLHHIVFDGWSTGVLLREVALYYRSYVAGQESPLPDLPIQYGDFAVWQRQWLQGEVLQRQLDYWKRQLGDEAKPFPLRSNCPTLSLPTDRPRPAVPTYRGGKQAVQISESLSAALQALSQRQGVTLFVTLLASFKLLLYGYSQQTEIWVGSPIANRHHAGTENLIGFFANTLVLRSQLTGHSKFTDLLASLQETTLEAYTHQDLPFEKVVDALQPERTLNSLPLFRVWFFLQPDPVPSVDLPELRLSLLDLDSGTSRYDLKLGLWQSRKGLMGSFEYATDLFDPSTIAHMSTHFDTLLHQIVAQPDLTLDQLVAVIQESDRQQQSQRAAAIASTSRQKLHQVKRKTIQG
jgi:amino acid adenylation domain-containing protein